MLLVLAVVVPMGARAATQPLVCSPAKLRFGRVTVGQSESQVIVLTNTGQSSTTISAISLKGAAFTVSGLQAPVVLSAGQSVTAQVVFAPTANGWTGGSLKFSPQAPNRSLQLPLEGAGVVSDALNATPSGLSFGQVAVGSTSTLSVVLTNASAGKEVLNAFQLEGGSFSVKSPTFPLTLNRGQSVTMTVAFAPLGTGTASGSIFISGPARNIPLTGTGTSTTAGQLTISPATLNMGKVMVGSTETQPASVSATGGSVTISSLASSSSQFTVPGVSLPLTIPAGQSVQFNVEFTPNSAGTASATLSFSSNAANSQTKESLTGTGTMPQVSLSWLPSTSQVSGYNVYRGTKPGSYSKINAALDPNTFFTDGTVSPGTTYYYAATAVSATGEESTYSTAVEVAVP